jgi:Crinkler effector protein N-terminal domain
MAKTLMLNCWVLGIGQRNVFIVKVSESDVVDSLKDAIKDKKKQTFRDIEADLLELYKVSSTISYARFPPNPHTSGRFPSLSPPQTSRRLSVISSVMTKTG